MKFVSQRILTIFLITVSLVILPVYAQDEVILPAIGDVPLVNKITVTSDEDDPTTSVITGEAGAVFPNAFVVVHNLYTHDREIVNASSNGSFVIGLYGRSQTPYWVSAFQRFPSDEAINTARGVIIFGEGNTDTMYVESDLGGHTPRYRITGDYTSTQITAGESWRLNLAIEMDITNEIFLLDGLQFSGEIYLLPVTDSPIQRRDYGWDIPNQRSLLPVLGAGSQPILLAEADASTIEKGETTIQFDMEFDTIIPELAQVGRYQVLFVGYVQVDDSERERWGNSPLLGTQDGNELNELDVTTSFPLWLSYESNSARELIWSLLPDNQSQAVVGGASWQVGAMSTAMLSGSRMILAPDTYSIEPFWVDSLEVPLADGQLTVRVLRPDGTTEEFDADIIQFERQLNSDKITLATDVPVLGEYPFTEYGDYEILLAGRLRIGENVYFTHERINPFTIRIAESLNLSPSLLAGTPLEVGDGLPIGLHIVPQFPADVTVTLTFTALDGVVTQSTQSGQADPYGFYAGEPIIIEQAGRYAIDYQARYTDAEGRLWSGELLSIGVIANPNGMMIAHGQRGVAGYAGVGQAWFNTSQYPNDDINATQQPYYPYFSGDVAYIPDRVDSGIYPRLTIQTAVSDSLPVESPDLSYLTVARPDLILRQFIADSDNPIVGFNGDDRFHQQIGAGIDGVRDGDYAFLFGGVITADDSTIYGGLMVVEDEDNPARVLSPFLDRLRVYGQEVDMLFVPTGARPGQVMTQNDRLSVVGQVAPTLPAEVSATVTSPSGQQTQFTDIANRIGYFYSPENDLVLDEIGIWNIHIKTTYQGETSLGQLERPYPVGDLSFPVYVVPPENIALGESEFMSTTGRVTQTYSLTVPEGWTDVRAFATITTPSAILVQDELTVFPAGASYTYNPTTLAREYPNIELLETTEGNHVADVLTLTLVMTGNDTNGNPAIRTRTYTITHDVTYTVDEGILR